MTIASLSAPDRLRRTAALALGLILTTTGLRAHDPGLSTLHVVARDQGTEFMLQLAPADAALLYPLDANRDGRVSDAEFADAQPVLATALARWVLVEPAGMLPAPWTGLSAQHDSAGSNVTLRGRLSRAPQGTWTLRLVRLPELPAAHRHLVTVVDASGSIIAEHRLSPAQPEATFAWQPTVRPTDAPRPGATPFGGFFRLGVEHILIGFDHLLFLTGLLLVCRRFREMVAIVTSFTVAHSLTLALATFDLITLPGRVVEPLIAASIVFVGVENLWRRGEPPRARWLLTFGFGLVHGLGFAGVLRDLGLGGAGWAALPPLLGFNLGVETGQLAVSGVLLPALLLARRRPGFERRVVPALSGLVALTGLFWLGQRLL